MKNSRRTFVQLCGGLIAAFKTLDVAACSEPWVTVVNLEGHLVTPSDESRDEYLARKLDTSDWHNDNGEVILIKVPQYAEGPVPFKVDVVSDTCDEIAVFLERHVPYAS